MEIAHCGERGSPCCASCWPGMPRGRAGRRDRETEGAREGARHSSDRERATEAAVVVELLYKLLSGFSSRLGSNELSCRGCHVVNPNSMYTITSVGLRRALITSLPHPPLLLPLPGSKFLWAGLLSFPSSPISLHCHPSAIMPSSTRCRALSPLPLLLLLASLFLACHHTELVAASAASPYDRRSCETAVLEWSTKEKLALNKQLQRVQHGSMQILDLLFFLHIPRTGGRTYHQCFLKNLYLPKDRCPRSYDKLRLDLSQPSCKLLSSHDDMSILAKIPSRTSIVTNMRNPVDRVLSTYEFSVEVAARFLRLKSINTSRSPLPRAKSPSQLVSTLTIWPWKYLVPFMQHDIFARRDARREGKVDWPPSSNTTYDAPTITMPLTEFIHHPVAHELVHNGATFQVAGLTNNSYVEGVGVIRKCISLYPKLGYQVLDVAKRRLDSMLFVGLTEKQQESATTFFSLMGGQVQVQSEALKEILDQNASVPVQEKDPPKLLLAAYKSCLASLRSSHAVRRASTLQLISPVKYSQEERLLIPSSVVDEIVSLNKLDMELYEYAKFLFAKQQRQFATSTLPQVKEGQTIVLSMFLALCVTTSILLLGYALMIRVRNRVGNDWVPFWLRRLAFMQAHEKL